MSSYRAIIKISALFVLIILFSSSVFATELYSPPSESDSMHRYNALENKNYFPNTISNTENSEANIEKVNSMQDSMQFKNIMKQQASSLEKSDIAMNTIENHTELRTFILGNSLGILKYQVVQMQDQSSALSNLITKEEYMNSKNQINSQINISEQQQTKVEEFIKEREEKFSLFGWLVNSI